MSCWNCAHDPRDDEDVYEANASCVDRSAPLATAKMQSRGSRSSRTTSTSSSPSTGRPTSLRAASSTGRRWATRTRTTSAPTASGGAMRAKSSRSHAERRWRSCDESLNVVTRARRRRRPLYVLPRRDNFGTLACQQVVEGRWEHLRFARPCHETVIERCAADTLTFAALPPPERMRRVREVGT